MSAVRNLTYQEVAAYIATLPMPVPGFDESDAARNVADTLAAADLSIELILAVANARDLMVWIAGNTTVPLHLSGDFRALDEWVSRVARLHADECEALGVESES